MDAPKASDARPVYQRIVLKLSGEALAGEGRVGFAFFQKGQSNGYLTTSASCQLDAPHWR